MSMTPRRVFATSFVLTIAAAPMASADPAKHWNVTKDPKGAGCLATEIGKKTSTPYACPSDDTKLPLKIVRPANSTECFADDGGRAAHANPPAPTEKLRCPK